VQPFDKWPIQGEYGDARERAAAQRGREIIVS
jgi:hypothetical protein